MKFFDSHIHLNSRSIEGWEEEKDWVFNNVSVTLEDFHVALEQSLKHGNVYVTAGIHPLEIGEHDMSSTLEDLDRNIRKHRDRIIAIGETGLDFYRADKESDFDRQQRWFYAQYELAKKYDLPLVLHVRNAHEEVLDLLSGLIGWRGVIHCFEADEKIMNRYLELPGEWMFSVSPVILRANSKFRHLIHKMDIGRMLVESDAPFLGKSHEVVPKLVEIIAEEKGIGFEECKGILWSNFRRCFGINID